MATSKKYFTILAIALPLTAIIIWLGLVAFADGDDAAGAADLDDSQEIISAQSEDETESNAESENEVEPIDASLEQSVQSIDFTIGSMEDLRDAQLSNLIEKIESVPGVAEKTKVWIAIADVASAPGQEEFFHIKGPLTCGRIGCDLVVMGEHNGVQKVFLETIGESVEAPAFDELVINKGTNQEVIWEFNGEEYVEK